jgi:hypothetical protein
MKKFFLILPLLLLSFSSWAGRGFTLANDSDMDFQVSFHYGVVGGALNYSQGFVSSNHTTVTVDVGSLTFLDYTNAAYNDDVLATWVGSDHVQSGSQEFFFNGSSGYFQGTIYIHVVNFGGGNSTNSPPSTNAPAGTKRIHFYWGKLRQSDGTYKRGVVGYYFK